jgi:hypothetical protein
LQFSQTSRSECEGTFPIRLDSGLFDEHFQCIFLIQFLRRQFLRSA